jgi:hypothetical protein
VGCSVQTELVSSWLEATSSPQRAAPEHGADSEPSRCQMLPKSRSGACYSLMTRTETSVDAAKGFWAPMTEKMSNQAGRARRK